VPHGQRDGSLRPYSRFSRQTKVPLYIKNLTCISEINNATMSTTLAVEASLVAKACVVLPGFWSLEEHRLLQLLKQPYRPRKQHQEFLLPQPQRTWLTPPLWPVLRQYPVAIVLLQTGRRECQYPARLTASLSGMQFYCQYSNLECVYSSYWYTTNTLIKTTVRNKYFLCSILLCTTTTCFGPDR
jgi:hypothetical protein